MLTPRMHYTVLYCTMMERGVINI